MDKYINILITNNNKIIICTESRSKMKILMTKKYIERIITITMVKSKSKTYNTRVK